MTTATSFPRALQVQIDSPKGSFVKRRDDGGIDFVSPLPTPFNYGSVPGTRAPDGDRQDAVVLGPRLSRGSQVHVAVVGVVRFVDGGADDAKWICSPAPLTAADELRVRAFFALYARAKRILNAARGARGSTRYVGFERADAR